MAATPSLPWTSRPCPSLHKPLELLPPHFGHEHASAASHPMPILLCYTLFISCHLSVRGYYSVSCTCSAGLNIGLELEWPRFVAKEHMKKGYLRRYLNAFCQDHVHVIMVPKINLSAHFCMVLLSCVCVCVCVYVHVCVGVVFKWLNAEVNLLMTTIISQQYFTLKLAHSEMIRDRFIF